MGTLHSYNQYWEARAKQSFWITLLVGSRLGAVLAMLAERLGLTPNQVSILSLLVGVGGAVGVALLPVYSLAGAWVLFLSLHLAYGLDCADGQLARVTKTGSIFGQLLDKVIDQAAAIAVPCILAVVALPAGAAILPSKSLLGILGFVLMSRAALSVTIWLKESIMYSSDRLREDHRVKGLGWWVKKIVGNLMDDITYRTGLAIAWYFGWFWEFLLVFGIATFGILLVYLLTTWRELSIFEAAQKKSAS